MNGTTPGSPGMMPYRSPYDFQDKVVVVMGGASGIGEAIARAYHAQGAVVYIAGMIPVPREVREQGDAAVSRHEKEAIHRLTESMPDSKGPYSRHQVEFVHANVTETANIRGRDHDGLQIERTIEAIGANHGRIDVLVDSVGWSPRQPLEQLSPDLLHTVNAVNADHLPFMLMAAKQWLKESKWDTPEGKISGGSVALIGSTLPHGMSDEAAFAYGAAKALRLAWATGLSNDMGKEGISVVTVSPGHVSTAAEHVIHGDKAPVVNAAAIAKRRVKVNHTPGMVAEAVLQNTAKPYANMVTGAEVRLDGGGKAMPTMHIELATQLQAMGQQLPVAASFSVAGQEVLLDRVAESARKNGELEERNRQLQDRLRQEEALKQAIAAELQSRGIDPVAILYNAQQRAAHPTTDIQVARGPGPQALLPARQPLRSQRVPQPPAGPGKK